MATVIEENDYYTVIKPLYGPNGDGNRPYTLNFGQILYARNVNARSYPSLGGINKNTTSLNKYSINKPTFDVGGSDDADKAGGLTKSSVFISDVALTGWQRNYRASPYWTDNSGIYSLQNSWTITAHPGTHYSFYDWYGYAHGTAMYEQPETGGWQSTPAYVQSIAMLIDGDTQGHFEATGFFVWDSQSAENFTTAGYPEAWNGSLVRYSGSGFGGDINSGYTYNEAGIMGLQHCYGTNNVSSSITLVFVITSSTRTYGCIMYAGSITKDSRISFSSVSHTVLFSGYNYSYAKDHDMLGVFANDENLTCTLAAVFDGPSNGSTLVSLDGFSRTLGSAGNGSSYQPLMYVTKLTVTIACYHGSYSSATDHALYFYVYDLNMSYYNPSAYSGTITISINYDGSTTGGGQTLPSEVFSTSTGTGTSGSTTFTTASFSEWSSAPSTSRPRLVAVWTNVSNMPSSYAINFSVRTPYNTDPETSPSNHTYNSGTIVFDTPNYSESTTKTVTMVS